MEECQKVLSDGILQELRMLEAEFKQKSNFVESIRLKGDIESATLKEAINELGDYDPCDESQMLDIVIGLHHKYH